MESLIQLFIFIPIAGFLISLTIPEKRESLISNVAFSVILLNLLVLCVFTFMWLMSGHIPLNLNEVILYQSSGYTFSIDFFFDRISLVYMMVGSLLTLLVTIYSRYYLHREEGYKRFFNTILFFYSGYSITVLSGNFETLFVGWEILGISSFLLIAFYRHRYLPVKNGIKVFSIYRIGDIGILLAMWMSHHLWHENITFVKLSNYELVSEHLQNHSLVGVFISLMILVAASAKSAQLPFSSWLPRAMEGPTPSSAIFYGSLSVHIGAFLLLRTFPFWENQFSVRVIIGLLGLSTAIVATFIARVQSSVKSQIAYASVSQIGIIFIEVAAGFEILALIHFAGNAFLRTYQLLVSPSVVSYLIREQFYKFEQPEHKEIPAWKRRLNYSIYTLSIKEFNLDWFMYKYVWGVLKTIGKKVSILKTREVITVYAGMLLISSFLLFHQSYIPEILQHYTSTFLAFAGLLMVLRSFVERQNPIAAWVLIMLNHFFIVMAISFNEHFNLDHTVLYLGGVIVCGMAGLICLSILKQREPHVDLNQFYGYSVKYRRMGFVFLLACLGLTGFPITSTFIGEDLIYTHIHHNQVLLATFISVSLIVDGITLIRLYSRIFLGPFIEDGHESPYRSS